MLNYAQLRNYGIMAHHLPSTEPGTLTPTPFFLFLLSHLSFLVGPHMPLHHQYQHQHQPFMACTGKDGRCDLRACMVACKEQLGIQSVLIEGGANILTSVFELRLAHQVLVSRSLRLKFKGTFVYSVGMLCNVECCIR